MTPFEAAIARALHDALGTHSRPLFTRQICPGFERHSKEAAVIVRSLAADPQMVRLRDLLVSAGDWLAHGDVDAADHDIVSALEIVWPGFATLTEPERTP